MSKIDFHATTILSVRRGDKVAIAGDGQVTMDTVVAKGDAPFGKPFGRGR